MPTLSDAGTQLVNTLSQRHGVSTDAVTHMLIAVQNGNGSMAQFNHPEFGGCGQWMRGGMTMVSDLFNNHLKYRVDSICNDISNELANNQLTPFAGSFQSQSQNGSNSQMQAGGAMGSANSLFVPDPEANWWPQDLGAPNAVGSQNNVRYAYFANSRRLAVKTGSDIWVYDTGDHQIGGFSQQQGAGGSITFTSQYGVVNLSTLPVISQNGVTPPAPAMPEPVAEQNSCSTPIQNEESVSIPLNATNDSIPASSSGDDILEMLERLGGLCDKNYITKEEFAAKKAELLKRL
ncbi:MAG TPA: SHOCT domain-containing protein [Planctomycetaceae bacterium]|nr:SHOCT domain-containing protein [Planctomycetaceae bacterium]|tara:strand:+ start:792 stop:1664 length:873 start_codon:yes stop_codon:yes gene_type:complete